MRRRDMLATGAAAGAVALAARATAQTDDGGKIVWPEPTLTFAFQADVRLGPVREIGVVDGMRRRIVPIAGGTVHGPRLGGTVMPGGADWQGVRPDDGLTRVFARYWIEADDGTVIGVENAGIRRAPPDIVKRLMAGEPVAPTDYYFRTVPSFEVGAGPHRWLDETMFACVGARLADRAIIRVYALG